MKTEEEIKKQIAWIKNHIEKNKSYLKNAELSHFVGGITYLEWVLK